VDSNLQRGAALRGRSKLRGIHTALCRSSPLGESLGCGADRFWLVRAGYGVIECTAAVRASVGDTLAKKAIIVIAAVFIVVLAPPLRAQQQPQTKPVRFELTPFMGYRTSMSFPVDPHVTGANPRVVLDASPSYGVAFGVRLHAEEDMVEVRWARQDSYVHAEDITPQPGRQRVILDQFHGDFSHEPMVEDWAEWAKPFVIASVGATHVSSNTNINFTRFSFGIGGGIRFYPSRHFGFKIQAEWLPVFADPHVAFICGAGCIVHVGGTLSSQGEVLAGPILRF